MSKLRFSSFGLTTQQATNALNWAIGILLAIILAFAGCSLL